MGTFEVAAAAVKPRGCQVAGHGPVQALAVLRAKHVAGHRRAPGAGRPATDPGPIPEQQPAAVRANLRRLDLAGGKPPLAATGAFRRRNSENVLTGGHRQDSRY